MKTKAIMVQGTGSYVGKSVIVAGLCRIFKKDGFKVAPFKAQNMALNSYPTKNGREIGRAQAMQAEASCIEPSAYMNPILLKPVSDVGSQVVVLGKPFKNMNVNEYHKFQDKAFSIVKKAYKKLAKNFDIIVIEGAGSPAEVNLRKHDIVNMKIAKFAKAPVILVGDIDYGGVFAWLIGTLSLLTDLERRLIKGFIINKFRGNIDILNPGLDYLTRKTKIPVLGVVPYIKNLRIDEEDSLAFRNIKKEKNDAGKSISKVVSIAVIYLPHIANFTDLDSLNEEDDVNLYFVKDKNELGNPDAIIIPGTKSTLNDMKYLHNTGLADEIIRLGRSGIFIFGICGGYQIIGKEIRDSLGVESKIKSIKGLGLLNTITEFRKKKFSCQVCAKALRNDSLFNTKEELKGYEIHMGVTKLNKHTMPLLKIKRINTDKEVFDGAVNKNGNVYGTYLHGIFDNNCFRRRFINILRKRRGLLPFENTNIIDREEEYNRLADIVRENLDIKKIYDILNKGDN